MSGGIAVRPLPKRKDQDDGRLMEAGESSKDEREERRVEVPEKLRRKSRKELLDLVRKELDEG